MAAQWLIVHSRSRERAREWVKAEVGARNSLRTPSAVIWVKLTCFSYALNFEHPCRQTDPAKASDREAVVSYSEAVTVMAVTFFSTPESYTSSCFTKDLMLWCPCQVSSRLAPQRCTGICATPAGWVSWRNWRCNGEWNEQRGLKGKGEGFFFFSQAKFHGTLIQGQRSSVYTVGRGEGGKGSEEETGPTANKMKKGRRDKGVRG